MNDFGFHCNGESVAAMVCACDVIQAKLMGGVPRTAQHCFGKVQNFSETVFGKVPHFSETQSENLHQLTMIGCMEAE